MYIYIYIYICRLTPVLWECYTVIHSLYTYIDNIGIYICPFMYIHINIYTYSFMYIYIKMCGIYIRINVYVCMCVYICIAIYTFNINIHKIVHIDDIYLCHRCTNL